MVATQGEHTLAHIPYLSVKLFLRFTSAVLCFETVNVFITKKLLPSFYMGSFDLPFGPDEEKYNESKR